MKVEFDIASDQIDGARDYQEDAYMVNQLGEADNGDVCSLIIMADGMGGHLGGEIASSLTVNTIIESLQQNLPAINNSQPDSNAGFSQESICIQDAIEQAVRDRKTWKDKEYIREQHYERWQQDKTD